MKAKRITVVSLAYQGRAVVAREVLREDLKHPLKEGVPISTTFDPPDCDRIEISWWVGDV